MTITTWKKAVSGTLGAAAALTLGYLLSREKPPTVFDFVNFGLAAVSFAFAVYQVMMEAKAKEEASKLVEKVQQTSRKRLEGLYVSLDEAIGDAEILSLQSDSPFIAAKGVTTILRRERASVRTLLHEDGGEVLNRLKDISDGDSNTVQLIYDEQSAREALERIVLESTSYLYIVGGRSRSTEYLQKIVQRVSGGTVKYVRIITGDHIRRPLYDHLVALEALREVDRPLEVEIGYLPEDKYAQVTVSPTQVFVALPSMKTQLSGGILIRSPRVASDLREYVVSLLERSDRSKPLPFYESLIKSL